MKVIICMLFTLFAVTAFSMPVSKWEVSEIDFEKDPVVRALHETLPQPVYPQDYRTIPSNDELTEQPDTSQFYYEEYDKTHPECVRVNDKLMMCPGKIVLTPDEMIAKEMRFDEHYGNCEKHLGSVIVCKRGKR